MIQADFTVNTDSQIISFQITGHADSGPYGSDIVCAAVSAVSIGTINSLQKLAGFEPEVEADNLNGGLLTCQIPATVSGQALATAQILLQNLQLTLEDITQQYGQYIQVQTKRK